MCLFQHWVSFSAGNMEGNYVVDLAQPMINDILIIYVLN